PPVTSVPFRNCTRPAPRPRILLRARPETVAPVHPVHVSVDSVWSPAPFFHRSSPPLPHRVGGSGAPQGQPAPRDAAVTAFSCPSSTERALILGQSHRFIGFRQDVLRRVGTFSHDNPETGRHGNRCAFDVDGLIKDSLKSS